MKPDWKDAPEWANWLAMDENGVWFWFENEPTVNVDVWGARRGKIEIIEDGVEWTDTKEKRPQQENNHV